MCISTWLEELRLLIDNIYISHRYESDILILWAHKYEIISAFSETIHSETNMNFTNIGLYDVWDQVHAYKSGDNQNWHHLRLVGRKEQIDCLLQRGFYWRPVPPRASFSPASQSFSHSGNDNRSINICILERQVLQYPPGETAHEQAGTLPCATSFQNFHSSALEVVTPQRAEIQYLKASIDAFSSFLFYL